MILFVWLRKEGNYFCFSVPYLFYKICTHFLFTKKLYIIEKTSQFTFDAINQQKCSFMILLFVCRKEGRSHHKKKITISVQKQFLKLLQPHQGAEPSAGFYILEKVGKRLPPAVSGRKYSVFLL